MENEWELPSCVDWAGCCADFETEEEEAGIRRAAAESDAEDSAMDRYYQRIET